MQKRQTFQQRWLSATQKETGLYELHIKLCISTYVCTINMLVCVTTTVTVQEAKAKMLKINLIATITDHLLFGSCDEIPAMCKRQTLRLNQTINLP